MSKKSCCSFDLSGCDNNFNKDISPPLFSERSETASHKDRLIVRNPDFTDFKKTQNQTKTEENQS